MKPIHDKLQIKNSTFSTKTEINEAKAKAVEKVTALILKTISYCYSKEEAQQVKGAAKLAIRFIQEYVNQGDSGTEVKLKDKLEQELTTLAPKAKQLFEELTQGEYRGDLETTSTHKSFMSKKLNTYFTSTTNYTKTNQNLISVIDNLNESELIHHDRLSQGSVITPLPDLPAEVYREIFNYMDKLEEQLALRLLSRHAEILVTDRINPRNPLKFLKLKPDTNNLHDSFKALCKYIASPRCTTTHLDLSGINFTEDNLFAELVFALKSNQSITNLNLESCQIYGSRIESLNVLPNLINLNLRNNLIHPIGAKAIATRMPNLVALDISYTQITSGLQHILQLQKLKILDVSHNYFIDEILQNILPPESLTDLFISTESSSKQARLRTRLSDSIRNLQISSIPYMLLASDPPFKVLAPSQVDWKA
ncbi:MAG: leucine-rich repeat domain-containing protein [Burkholderiales bacterium]